MNLFIALVFTASLSNAGTNGEELKLTKKPDGKYSFGVNYAYDVDFGWMLTYATEIQNKALGTLPEKLKWNIYNKKSGKFITSWAETEKHSLKLGQFSIQNKKTVKEILTHQTDIEFVFAIEKEGKAEPKYFLPIGDFCKKDLTDYFKNLTDPHKRCDQIKEADVPVASNDKQKVEGLAIKHPSKANHSN